MKHLSQHHLLGFFSFPGIARGRAISPEEGGKRNPGGPRAHRFPEAPRIKPAYGMPRAPMDGF